MSNRRQIELIQEHGLSADRIASVRLTVGENSYFLCGENKFVPPNSAEALWNHRYSVAVACTKGEVFADSFTEEAIQDPEVKAFIPKVDVIPDASMRFEVQVDVVTLDGKTLTKRLDDMEPVAKTNIIEKFEKCCRYAVSPLTEECIQDCIHIVDRLEELDDLEKLMKLLT